VIGIAFVAGVYVRSVSQSSKTDVAVVAPETTGAEASSTAAPSQQPETADASSPAADAQTQAAESQTAQAVAAAVKLEGLKPQTYKAQASHIGSNDPQSPYTMKVEFTAWGAGIHSITLADYRETATSNTPYTVQGSLPVLGKGGSSYSYYPFASRSITINGQTIDLESVAWDLKAPGQYQLELLSGDTPALRLTRRYSLAAGKDNFELLLEQNIENLTGQPISVIWEQSILAEQPADTGSYMGDQRRAFVGYFNTKHDPQRKYVINDSDTHVHYPSILKNVQEGEPFFWPLKGNRDPLEMAWFGDTNRYFASVVHRPLITAPAAGGQGTTTQVEPLDKLFAGIRPRLVTAQGLPGQPASASFTATPALIYTLTSRPLTIAPGSSQNLDLAFYAGPRDSKILKQPPYSDLGFSSLLHYELSCAICTFQWLAKGLLAFLKGIHFVLKDWGVAIILLVLVVRIILHPITKKSQIAMTKMGKQMAAIQPEMEKIKAKYANDPTKQNQEIMRLYREKGINPAGMLGCLPMFLQMPIWVALYAMIYFAIELRHEPAFYGIFQTISGGSWAFLADLSTSDNFIKLNKSFTLPLYFVNPQFSGINIIPLLMAVFFYLQQSLMMPPAANEQQAQQQKIGKWMTLMVPIFLYSAPSGLTLYMLASSIGGMIDGWIVRRHIKKQEEAGTLFDTKPRKPAKPGGLWDRVQKALEAQQQKIAEQQKLAQQNQKKPGKGN